MLLIKRVGYFGFSGFILSLFILFSCTDNSASTPERSENSDSIMELMCSEFQRRNPKVELIELLDLSRIRWKNPVDYIVLARAIVKDSRFEGLPEDELFGVFVLNSSLDSIVHVLEIFPTPRWNDYSLAIIGFEESTVIIKGEGDTYGDQANEYRYDLTEEAENE